MGRLHSSIALAACLLLANAQPTARPLTAEEIQTFREDRNGFRAYDPPLLTSFDQALREALASGTVEQAADALAARHGLGSVQMRALTRLWLTVRARRFSYRGNEGEKILLRRELRALLPAVRSSPLGLQLAAEALDWLNECDGEDFAALLAGSADPGADAWAVADAATCNDNFLRAAAAAPDKAMPALIRAAHFGGLDLRAQLPLHHWLSRPEQLARIAEADRPAVSALLHRRYARALFRAGLTDRAVAVIDALPPALRQRTLADASARFAATVDGLPISFDPRHENEDVSVEVAAAYALAGRTAEAEALFAAMPRLAGARRSFDCAWSTNSIEPSSPCARQSHDDSIGNNIDLLLLDHFLHRPGDDPYPLAETGFGGMGGGSTIGGGTAALSCRIFAEARFQDICRNAQRTILSYLTPGAWTAGGDAASARSLLAALNLPGFEAAQADSEAEIAHVMATLPTTEPAGRSTPPSVTPTPPPFAELPLPERYRGTRPQSARVPTGTADLPPGFMPVRFERSGARAAAISVSQSYDPTGEVSQGGYWLHLSEDGGRSWQTPLYTGLAQSFPYVVPATSRLPMLNGDRLDLEVAVEEIDTASITYPPVGLRTRRRAENLYLQIPLANLSRDSDGDGLTDIAARSLLLDRPRGAAATPFVVGSDAGADCAAPDPDRAALIALLERLFSRGSGAIVEPVDRAAEAPLMAGWRRATASAERPVFIQGDPSDYRCLRANRLMVVYSEADIAALERFRPDFHAVKVPPIVYNRDRDRGYVIYSLGWAGGTFRLRLVDGAWVFDEISSWIS